MSLTLQKKIRLNCSQFLVSFLANIALFKIKASQVCKEVARVWHARDFYLMPASRWALLPLPSTEPGKRLRECPMPRTRASEYSTHEVRPPTGVTRFYWNRAGTGYSLLTSAPVGAHGLQTQCAVKRSSTSPFFLIALKVQTTKKCNYVTYQ